MDKTVLQMYKKYGLMVNSNRMFPLDIDGLKPVERRILLSAYQIARDKFVKCARVDGHCMGNFHPHSSSYGTLVQLYHQGFLDGQGNFGNKYSIEETPAAASRYTECKLKKETFNLAFKLIDYVPWVMCEVKDPAILEPAYLPTKYPISLIGKRFIDNIGFGYRTVIPSYSEKDLKSRLLYLLGITKTKPIIKPLTDCQVLTGNDDLEKLLTTGKGQVTFKGIYKVDASKSRVIIKSMPPGRKFESLLSKFDNELNNQDIGWIDESAAMNGGTHIVFEVIKSRNRDLIFKTFVKKLDDILKNTISFEMIVVDYETRNTKLISVDKMLLNTYKMYKNVNMLMLKSEVNKFKKTKEEHSIIQKIRPFLGKELNTKENNIEIISDNIAKKISLVSIDKNIVKDIIQKHRISKLLSASDDIKELDDKIKEINENIKNIDNFVLTQYN